MFWVDGYADMYQEINGFESTVYTPEGEKTAWISMKPTTRAAYDLSMRENTIDGIITMDGLDKLKSGYIYILKDDPLNKYFIQTLSKWEQQLRTLNFNAIRCNCTVTVQRKGFEDDDAAEETWIDIYKDVDASISFTLNDSKNFNAGFENATYNVVQMPMWEFVEEEDEEGNVKMVEKPRRVEANDRLVVKSNFFSNVVGNEFDCQIAVESVDNYGISGTIKVQGTQEMRV